MGKILKEYMWKQSYEWKGTATKLVSLSIFVAFLENMKFKKFPSKHNPSLQPT